MTKKISELTTVTEYGPADLLEIAIEDPSSDTGFSSRSIPVSSIAGNSDVSIPYRHTFSNTVSMSAYSTFTIEFPFTYFVDTLKVNPSDFKLIAALFKFRFVAIVDSTDGLSTNREPVSVDCDVYFHEDSPTKFAKLRTLWATEDVRYEIPNYNGLVDGVETPISMIYPIRVFFRDNGQEYGSVLVEFNVIGPTEADSLEFTGVQFKGYADVVTAFGPNRF